MMKSLRNLLSLFLFAVTCSVLTMAQVCPYNDTKCDCFIDSIICKNLTEIPPLNTRINVTDFTDLTFQDGNIISISRNSLPPGLTTISLINLPLSNISDDAFDELATTLKHVGILGANFNNLPTALKKLTRLTELNLIDTSIHIWDSATLKQIGSTLMDLKLENVSLSSWPSWISDFHLLRTLDLSYNSINHIPDYAFVSIKDSLTELRLHSTGLTHVPQALSSLSSLKLLDLSLNNFTDPSTIEMINAFPFARKLFNLFLDSIGLTRIANFSNLTGLGEISLSGNRISDIADGLLPASLTTLYISHNGLTSVPKAVASMPKLYTLLLSSNHITDIEPDSFPSSLLYLDLSSNNLTILTNTTFRNLYFLQFLHLESNPITTISPSAFEDLVSMFYLSIEETQLTEFPLALMQLTRSAIDFSTTQPLSCPCPAPHDLVQWFTSLINPPVFEDNCSNGQPVESYLRGQCAQPTATP